MESRDIKIKNSLAALLLLLILLSGVFLLKAYLSGHFDSAQAFRVYIGGFGIFAPAMLILIQALQVVLPVLPGFLGCIVGAGMFGTLGGFFCNYIGISAGSIIAFFLARRFGSGLVKKMISQKKYDSYMAWIDKQLCTKKRYTAVLFLAILLPLAPDDFLCYFSGLTGMPAKKFIWVILLGKPWCILVYSIIFGYIL